MSARSVKRRIIISCALVWEIVRLGLLWNAHQELFAGAYGQVNTFLLLWLSAPVLALIAGYLIVLTDPEADRICILLVMGRAFQSIFGVLALFSFLAGFITNPIVQASVALIMIITVGDIVALGLQLTDVITKRETLLNADSPD
ncbi:MAG: hypothetical protein ACQEQU_06600 [Spirochaetota bacterium]